MGNVSDKDGGSSLGDESLYDTIARDITYKNYTDKHPVGGRRESDLSGRQGGRIRKPATRSVSRRRSSFRASKRSNSKSKLRLISGRETADSKFLISEMEVKVDGKVAKLVPRQSVLKRKGFPVFDHKASTNIETKTRPKQLVKLAQEARRSLCKKQSYEAAISTSVIPQASQPNRCISEQIRNKATNENKRWSQFDIPRRTPVQPVYRTKSSYLNINNNNTDSSHLTATSNTTSRNDLSRKLSGHDVYRELSGELEKLALVSPITDV